MRVETEIDIAAKLLGLTVYRYSLSANEVWSDGSLSTLTAQTNDNGNRQFARAERSGGAIAVEGSAYSGSAPANAATTSYWSPAFLRRSTWISTQDGRLLDVTATNLGPAAFPTLDGGETSATRWRIGGDLTDLFLFYDESDEWVGTEFPARGETARFVAASGPALTPLWTGA